MNHPTQKRTYLVTGATGRLGSKVVRKLLERGHGVRAFGRDRGRLSPLVDLGAEAAVGDMRDLASVTAAFRGVDAAMLACQGDRQSHDYRRDFAMVGENYAAAARETGLSWAVFVSSSGAHDPQNRGLVLIHADVERVLDVVPGLNVLHLRAPAFYENLGYYAEHLGERGAFTWPVAATAQVEMGSTHDLALGVVKHLTALDFSGKQVIELLGPELVTVGTIPGLIAEAMGQPITGDPLPRQRDIERIVASGEGRDFATLMHDTWELFSRRLVRGDETRPTVRMPTRLEEYIRKELVPGL